MVSGQCRRLVLRMRAGVPVPVAAARMRVCVRARVAPGEVCVRRDVPYVHDATRHHEPSAHATASATDAHRLRAHVPEAHLSRTTQTLLNVSNHFVIAHPPHVRSRRVRVQHANVTACLFSEKFMGSTGNQPFMHGACTVTRLRPAGWTQATVHGAALPPHAPSRRNRCRTCVFSMSDVLVAPSRGDAMVRDAWNTEVRNGKTS